MAWARVGEPVGAPAVRDNACVPVPPPAAGTSALAAIRLGAPGAAELTFDEGSGLYRADGPRRASGAAWAVGDAALLRRDGSRVLAPGAVRLAEVPPVRLVTALPDGSIAVRWGPTRADVRVRVEARGVAVECRGRDDGAVLPGWASRPGAAVSLRAVTDRVTWIRDEAVLDVQASLSEGVDLAGALARGASAGNRRGREASEATKLPAPTLLPRKPVRWRATRG